MGNPSLRLSEVLSNPFENYMGVFVASRMKKIQSKMEAQEWSQHFSHYKYMRIFQVLNGSYLIGPWLDPAEFKTHLSFYGCPCYMKE